MKHIRQKLKQLPTQIIRVAYVIVDTSEWYDTLENHPKILNQSELYEITDEPIPTDLKLWSVEYEKN